MIRNYHVYGDVVGRERGVVPGKAGRLTRR